MILFMEPGRNFGNRIFNTCGTVYCSTGIFLFFRTIADNKILNALS
ncbi:hypothetical protein HYH34_15420 [Clostridium botulinum]|nr:hypothetical protein [Clostridium botulinum]MBY6825049.1 hypothetical protein [Clostridium botulinum]MBY6835436.1 hypothetical protein [Clostridium botulinum]MBY6973972.1 hypothetical protein [Clostridium botulinum]HBJ1650772.1 hypothetical protein [Clostridium botulinum]